MPAKSTTAIKRETTANEAVRCEIADEAGKHMAESEADVNCGSDWDEDVKPGFDSSDCEQPRKRSKTTTMGNRKRTNRHGKPKGERSPRKPTTNGTKWTGAELEAVFAAVGQGVTHRHFQGVVAGRTAAQCYSNWR